MILCKNDKCSISQTKNTNCRAIATYCAIELYLLNDPCALFKRMDILLGNPKTVLIQSIISTNYINYMVKD